MELLLEYLHSLKLIDLYDLAIAENQFIEAVVKPKEFKEKAEIAMGEGKSIGDTSHKLNVYGIFLYLRKF